MENIPETIQVVIELDLIEVEVHETVTSNESYELIDMDLSEVGRR